MTARVRFAHRHSLHGHSEHPALGDRHLRLRRRKRPRPHPGCLLRRGETASAPVLPRDFALPFSQGFPILGSPIQDLRPCGYGGHRPPLSTKVSAIGVTDPAVMTAKDGGEPLFHNSSFATSSILLLLPRSWAAATTEGGN